MRREYLWGALLGLASGAAWSATVTVAVDPSLDRRAIDPHIYGVNFADAAQLADPGYTVNRWGGNHTTRYNWKVDVSNRAFDYVFLNVAEDDGGALPDDSSANRFIQRTRDAGAEPLLTLGTIGWTPLDLREKRYGFSITKYGAQLQNGCPYDCDGGRGECSVAQNATGFCVDRPSGPDLIVGNDPADTSQPAPPAWNADWIQHLRQRHGAAAAGGVRFYALDNEVMLWNSTHRDVHPTPPDYDEIWFDRTVPYAAAIKAAEPDAKVFGPVTWGYCDLFSSAADGCHFGPDRTAHGDLPFVQWYLRQVCAYQAQHGVRLVDYLDLHYYPQGADIIDFESDDLDVSESPAVAARRLRSVKELYDPAWVAESWMGTLGDYDQYHYDKPQFLRRVRAWIDDECPGTKLAVTEYNWGPDLGLSSALAQVEVLALFGREGVDLATRWTVPAAGSLAERAFRLFLDYDGLGSRVVGDSVRAVSSNVDLLGAYAVDRPGERLMLVLVNKDTTATTAQLSFAAALHGPYTVYRFDAANDVAAVAAGSVGGTALSLSLPARTASLVVLPAVGSTPDDVFANGFEGG